MSKNVESKIAVAGSVILAIVLFLTINLVSAHLLARFKLDLTENQLYSLSEQTVSTLQTLTEQINLTLFLTRSELLNIPGIGSYASRVEDLLREFERLSKGNIAVSVVDPRPFSETEDLAVGHGLQGIPLQIGTKLYFGLVATNSIDGTQVIPHFFLEREELLEYDLMRLILLLDGRTRKKVGLISSLPVQGSGGPLAGTASQQRPWTFFTQLNEIFDVELLSPSIDTLPDDIEMLFLLHPRNLSDSLLYAIDQFVLRGNSLLLAVDPFSEVLSSILNSTTLSELDTGSDLNRLTTEWGVTLKGDVIVGDLPIAARVLEGDGSSGRTIDYPVWMNIQPNQLNPQDVVTAKLGNLTLATAGVFEIDPDLSTDITPLIRTSKSAKLYSTEQFTQVSEIRELLEDYQEGNQQWVMAARVRGPASSAFPDGIPPSEGVDTSPDNHQHQLEGDINVIVIADTDFLHDRFWVRTQQSLGQTLFFAEASNGELVNNAIDNLSGDNRLLGVRTRGRSFRPFVVTQIIRQAAERKYLKHEQELQQELGRIETFLTDFAATREGSSAEIIITEEQAAEVKQIRDSQISIRRQLREVQHNLVKDIQLLENRLTLLNLLTVPCLLAIVGGLMCTLGARRRERRLALQIKARLH